MCRRGGAPIRSAPARHAVRALRSRPASRARSEVTCWDPAAPGWHRARLNPTQPRRASAPRAASGSARPLAGRKRPVSSSGARVVGQRQSPPPRAEGPHGPPLRETVGLAPMGSGRLVAHGMRECDQKGQSLLIDLARRGDGVREWQGKRGWSTRGRVTT
jgi:hypothetical protein